MFGVLKGAACSMEPGQRQQWTGHLCGVCLALQGRYGLVSRVATNYDAALLSVLYEAQSPQPPARRLSRCPFRRSFKAEIVDPDNPGTEYAASMALMAASSKIRDHLEDNEGRLRLVRGLATGVANRWMRAAWETTASLGLEAGLIDRQIRRQAEVEARPNQAFSFYAEPTELAVGTAFGQTAVLAARPQNADLLYEMGRMFGRIMLLLDSHEDYAADRQAQRFNALAAAFPEAEWEQQASRIFCTAHRALRQSFHQLDLPNPVLLRTLLLRQLQRRGYRTLQICHGHAPGCRALAGRTAAAPPADLLQPAHWPGAEGRGVHRVEPEDEWQAQIPGPGPQEPDWCFLGNFLYCCDCDCSDGGCCDCDCSDGDCCGCDCGDGGCDCADCGDCDCGDCGACDCGDCGGCDCGGCDCGGCDCGGCDCNF